jgi:hypothetical protein
LFGGSIPTLAEEAEEAVRGVGHICICFTPVCNLQIVAITTGHILVFLNQLKFFIHIKYTETGPNLFEEKMRK